MTENITKNPVKYPEKFSKRNVWGGIVTTGFIIVMHGKSPRTAYNWLKKCKFRLKKENVTVKDWALHLGFNSVEDYAEETNRNLKY